MTSPTAPRVSVIISTHNRAPLLVEAVGSVLAQSYRNYELIVADDGSTDDTAQRLAVYGSSVRYLALPHDGRPEAVRNGGAAVARGHFLAFLDDDDLWHREKLARAVALLEQDERLGYVYGDCRFRYADGSLSAPLLSAGQRSAASVFDDLLRDCFIHPSTVVMRRPLFEALGPFDATPGFQGDYYLWLRAARAAPVGCLAQPLVYLRHYPDSVARQRALQNYENAIRALERLRQEEALSLRQRRQIRRTLSRWYATLGLGQPRSARGRHALVRSLRLNPVQRRAWLALLRP